MGKLIFLAVVALALQVPPATSQDEEGRAINPCAAVLCPTGTQCVLIEVQCITTPCDPQPSCEPIELPAISCANVRCRDGYKCVPNPGCFQNTCPHAPPRCVRAPRNEISDSPALA